jgi:hypothetical protein
MKNQESMYLKTIDELAKIYNISRVTLCKLLKIWRNKGEIKRAKRPLSRKFLFDEREVERLIHEPIEN